MKWAPYVLMGLGAALMLVSLGGRIEQWSHTCPSSSGLSDENIEAGAVFVQRIDVPPQMWECYATASWEIDLVCQPGLAIYPCLRATKNSLLTISECWRRYGEE